MADPEPFFSEVPSGIQMTEAFNWYGSYKSWADSQKYIIEWLSAQKRTEDAVKVKSLAQHEISWVCGWICRLRSKGSKVNEQSVKYCDQWLSTL
jgi:hypothetical protein